jgi:ribosomal protein L18E
VAQGAEVQVLQTQQTPVAQRHLRAKETTVAPELSPAGRTQAEVAVGRAALVETADQAVVVPAEPAHRTTSLAHL